MNAITKTWLSLAGQSRDRAGVARPVVKRGLECEAMEDRQLLSAAPWSMAAAGFAAGKTPPADHHAWDATGDKRPKTGSFTPPHPLHQRQRAAKTDMATLKTDETTLQTEIKGDAAVTTAQAAVTADQKAITSALGITLPAKPTGTAPASATPHDRFSPRTDPSLAANFYKDTKGGPGGPGGPAGAFGPRGMAPGAMDDGPKTLPTSMVTKLEGAGITSAQITQFQTDQTNLQNAIQAVDPTLQTKIQADQTAVKADLPAPTMKFDHIVSASSTTSTS